MAKGGYVSKGGWGSIRPPCAHALAHEHSLSPRRARRREARRKTELKNVFVLYSLRRQGVKYFFFSPICDLVATVAAA